MINPELALRMVRESKVIAYDTETTGLTVTDKIVGYVISDEQNSVYVPVRHDLGGNIPDAARFEQELAAAFLDRSRLGLRSVGHNVGFDLRVSLRHGIVLGGSLEDTMINEALINDLTVGYGLDDCTERWGVTAKKGSELYVELAKRFGGLPDRKTMRHFWRIEGDNELAVDYACGDGVSTLALWKAQQAKLDEMSLRKVWKLECDLIPYLARMHNRGLRIDGEYAPRINGEIEQSIGEASKIFTPGFNARSSQDVEKLYRFNGYTDSLFDHTDKGTVSFTEKWLEKNEIGQAILGVRRLQKARDSFIAPLIDTHNIGGRVHPILNQSKSDDYGVAGARLSCSEPNLQAFPKRNMDVGAIVRRLVIPDEGMLLEEGDAKQQEPRLFTHYSEEPALLHGYQTGTFDIYDRAGEVLGGLSRDTIKRLTMGMLTMMSVKTLSTHMQCPYDEADFMHKTFLREAFPKIGEFQALAVKVFRNRGHVKSILGRWAHCDDPKFGYRAVSRIVQNSGGDHIKTCMLRANQYEDTYPEVQMLLSIHDSMMWQRSPGHDNTELIKILENVAHEPDFQLKVPIPFEVGSGSNWAEASYGSKLDALQTGRPNA